MGQSAGDGQSGYFRRGSSKLAHSTAASASTTGEVAGGAGMSGMGQATYPGSMWVDTGRVRRHFIGSRSSGVGLSGALQDRCIADVAAPVASQVTASTKPTPGPPELATQAVSLSIVGSPYKAFPILC